MPLVVTSGWIQNIQALIQKQVWQEQAQTSVVSITSICLVLSHTYLVYVLRFDWLLGNWLLVRLISKSPIPNQPIKKFDFRWSSVGDFFFWLKSQLKKNPISITNFSCVFLSFWTQWKNLNDWYSNSFTASLDFNDQCFAWWLSSEWQKSTPSVFEAQKSYFLKIKNEFYEKDIIFPRCCPHDDKQL